MAASTGPAADTFPVFGTTATLLVTDPGRLGAARAIADAELAAVDRACNRFRPDSEISVLNAAGGSVTPVSDLFAELIAAALRAARLTGGAVDPTCGQALLAIGYDSDISRLRDAGPVVSPSSLRSPDGSPRLLSTRQRRAPLARDISRLRDAGPAVSPSSLRSPDGSPRLLSARTTVPGWRNVKLDQERGRVRLGRGALLDLGAIAKAWAADRCARLIAETAGCGVLVSLGGDIAVAGEPPPGGWQVRVTDDSAAGPGEPGQTVTIRSGGLATSSTTVRSWTVNGHRVHHIIDPATGAPADSCWRTASVAAGSCADANTASTAAIIRGEAAPAWLQDRGLPARLVRHDGTALTISGWPESSRQSGAPRRRK